MEESQELVQEFLIESGENLARLDREFVELEKAPTDKNLLSSIFRTIHTIKGTCGFLGFGTLEAITHRGENILSELREGTRTLTPELTTLLLESVDAVKQILANIEASGGEGDETYDDLRGRLQDAADTVESPGAATEISTADLTSDSDRVASSEGLSGSSAPFSPDQPPSDGVDSGLAPPTAAPPHGPQAEIEGAVVRSGLTDSTIRVDIGVLDSLMNLVGELVLARNQILQFTTTPRDAAFTATSQRLNLITTELQGHIMKTRMQPIRVVWNKFHRVVRDLGQSFGKQIEVVMDDECRGCGSHRASAILKHKLGLTSLDFRRPSARSG